MTMTVAKRQEIEKRIVRRVIREALKRGFSLNVDNGNGCLELEENLTSEQAMMEQMMLADEDRLYLFPRSSQDQPSWVYFIYGESGWDVINDYTTNLSEWMEPILDYAETLDPDA